MKKDIQFKDIVVERAKVLSKNMTRDKFVSMLTNSYCGFTEDEVQELARQMYDPKSPFTITYDIGEMKKLYDKDPDRVLQLLLETFTEKHADDIIGKIKEYGKKA